MEVSSRLIAFRTQCSRCRCRGRLWGKARVWWGRVRRRCGLWRVCICRLHLRVLHDASDNLSHVLYSCGTPLSLTRTPDDLVVRSAFGSPATPAAAAATGGFGAAASMTHKFGQVGASPSSAGGASFGALASQSSGYVRSLAVTRSLYPLHMMAGVRQILQTYRL